MPSLTKPTAEQIDKALALITQPHYYRRFFEGLKNAEWVIPLREKGFFSHPPAAERNEEQGTIGFRGWPESEYLVRMAKDKPEAVAETILAIPSTDNFRVHEDCIEAALLLPPNLAANIAAKEITWIKTQSKLVIVVPDKYGRLCVHLAIGGEKDKALELFAVLMQIQPPTASTRANANSAIEKKPNALFDAWHYEEVFKKHLPQLAPSIGLPLLDAICDLLEKYLEIAEKDRADSGKDHSFIWRPAIESHSQNMDGHLNSVLVGGCRSAAEILLKAKSISLDEILKTLAARKWLVFQRIAIHLVRSFAGTQSPHLIAFCTNKNLFDEVTVRHEYTLLLQERIMDIPTESIDVVFNWIKDGPDLVLWKEEEAKWAEKHPTEDDANKYKDLWQRERLAWFQEQIPDRWRAHFSDLIKSYPAPQHPDFPFYMSDGWVGPESPKSLEELKKLTLPELVDFLRAWKQPPKTFMEASMEGLGRALGDLVKAEPHRYTENAKAFIGIKPIYLQFLFQSLEEALNTETPYPLGNLLDLAEWAVQQKAQATGIEDHKNDKALSPSWASKAIASFLKSALQKDIVNIENREQVWRILAPITSDADPKPADEPEETEQNSMGPETLSINTPRGQAMHTVVQYALWVRRHLEKEPDAAIRLSRGMAEMPEVLEILNEHLDPSKDPSPAIRSVYGQWFPWLILLDPGWARDAVDKIFPTAGTSDRLRMAAWMTYITFCQPYDNVFDLLKQQYLLAIKGLDTNLPAKSRYANPDERVGQHLAAYYWRGKLTLTEPESLLPLYMSRATSKMRQSVMEYIGRSLRNTKDEVPAVVLKRLQDLWDWLVSTGPLAPAIAQEASAFGGWFVSSKLPNDWAMPRLVAAVKKAKSIEPDHAVIQQLIKAATVWPLESIAVLDTLARNDREGWKISYLESEAMAVLEITYRSDIAGARSATADLINYLGTRGYMQFGKILTQAST